MKLFVRTLALSIVSIHLMADLPAFGDEPEVAPHVENKVMNSRVSEEDTQKAIDFVMKVWNRKPSEPISEANMFSGAPGYHGPKGPRKKTFANGLVCVDPIRKEAVAAVQVSIPTLDPMQFTIFPHPEIADPFFFVNLSQKLGQFHASQPPEYAQKKALEKGMEETRNNLGREMMTLELIRLAPRGGANVEERRKKLDEWLGFVGLKTFTENPIINQLPKAVFDKYMEEIKHNISLSPKDPQPVEQEIAKLEDDFRGKTAQLEGLNRGMGEWLKELERLQGPFEQDIATSVQREPDGKVDEKGNPTYIVTRKKIPTKEDAPPHFAHLFQGPYQTGEIIPFYRPIGTTKTKFPDTERKNVRAFIPATLSSDAQLTISHSPHDTVMGIQVPVLGEDGIPMLTIDGNGRTTPAYETAFHWQRHIKIDGKDVVHDMFCY